MSAVETQQADIALKKALKSDGGEKDVTRRTYLGVENLGPGGQLGTIMKVRSVDRCISICILKRV